MAELSVQIENDEWQDFNQFKCVTRQEPHMQRVHLKDEDVTLSVLLDGCSDTDNGFNISYTSTDDMINHFDEKLQFCFKDFKNETIDPMKTINDTTLCDEIWNALSETYSNIMPVDWKHSRAHSLHLSTLCLKDRPQRLQSLNLDLSDDEDLREQMDMHSIIVSCITDEPLLTAEQVIEEIEVIMQDSLDMESQQNTLQSELSIISKKTPSHTSHIYEERARLMSVAKLNVWLEEVEMNIRGYSEELIQHLAMRDELEFEKEVKNNFISVLIDMQNRQKEHQEMLKKNKVQKTSVPHSRLERLPSSRFSMEGISSAIQNGFRQTFGNGGKAKQYITTVIPYERKDGSPSIRDLQIFIKILEAMRDDSDKVPSLLTDYILKVFCPGAPGGI